MEPSRTKVALTPSERYRRVSPPRGGAETFYAKNCKLIEDFGSLPSAPLPVQT
jgi:hypothetical protein